MPKRATLTYTSEDAPQANEAQLYVYYCKYSGQTALITDVDIDTVPRRRTDNSRVLDPTKHLVKLHTTPGDVKLVKRLGGKVERQFRFNVGKLPVAYKATEEEDGYIYVLDDAVTTYITKDLQPGVKVPVPPCISVGRDGLTEVVMEVDDKAGKAALIKISADAVRLQITSNISHDASKQELLQFLARILQVRLSELTLARGASNRNKVLTVDNQSPKMVYEKLQQHLQKLVQESTEKPAAL